MGNISDKFARLSALKPARGISMRAPELHAAEENDCVSQILGGGIASNHFGDHLVIRNWFSTPEFTPPAPAVLELLTKPATTDRARNTARNDNGRRYRRAIEDPEKWLFLDTETTGIAGGTGTYAFLIGMAWWDAGGLQVEQLFLRDFSEEHSQLQALAERLAGRPVLVTFNGKTFDWPLLENRFNMTRAIRVPQLAAHLDLLHPSRALWKLRLGSVRLVELERHVLDARKLGWHRGDDLASALIPQYYFDYLHGGVAEPLRRIVRHNQLDLRGLAALFGKINSILESRENGFGETDSLDLFGLSKFLQRRGEKELAHSACAHALQTGLPSEYRPQATRELALMVKRRGEMERAVALWQELISHPEETILACEQLAMHFERRSRDFLRAQEYAQLGLKTVQRQMLDCRDPFAKSRLARQADKLVCRLERLKHRIKSLDEAGATPLLAQVAAAGSRPRAR